MSAARHNFLPGLQKSKNLSDLPSASSARSNMQVGLNVPLFNSNTPFILVSSGSMGNNGALTVTTALNQTYDNGAYVYLPAGAIVTSSAAGWYYAVFSSTTAATVYNNTYSSGTPTIPASPTAFATTGPGAYTQVTTIIQGPAFTLPGNTLSGSARVNFEGSVRTNNTAGAKTLTVRAGSTAIRTSAMANATGSGFDGYLKARSAATRQLAVLRSTLGAGGGSGPDVATIDMSADQTINAALTLATATDWIALLHFDVAQVA